MTRDDRQRTFSVGAEVTLLQETGTGGEASARDGARREVGHL
ncbi:MAG: hypothetical protein M0Z33_13790 [Actinomycetota bacterium]|nr:hypothetical protein [Actinomycetota bacterium]